MAAGQCESRDMIGLIAATTSHDLTTGVRSLPIDGHADHDAVGRAKK